MSYLNRISSVILMLSIAVLACVAPAIATPSPDSSAIDTAVAETVIAGYVQDALSQTLPPTMQQPTFTFTPGPPTLTATETATPFPTSTATLFFTATPAVPLISVSVATNCRVGPGRIYRRVGAILVGETAEVYGRDPTGRYWYIRNPDSSSGFCWAWGEYATVSGNTSLLPVYTPPPTPSPTFTPTPSPDFNAVFVGLDTCASIGWWAEIELENTGSIPFRSMSITIRDTVTDVVVASFTDGFTNMDGCVSTVTRDTLRVDRSPVVSSPAFNYNPTGHRLRATITLCSDTGQKGTCVTEIIVFTP